MLVLIQPLGGLDGQRPVDEIHLHLVFFEAGQVDIQLVSGIRFAHIGLHQAFGVLAIQRIMAAARHHLERVTEKAIEQIFMKNSGQHKSFLLTDLSMPPYGRLRAAGIGGRSGGPEARASVPFGERLYYST